MTSIANVARNRLRSVLRRFSSSSTPRADQLQPKLQKEVTHLRGEVKRLSQSISKLDRQKKALRVSLDQLSHEFGLLTSQKKDSSRSLTEQEQFWIGAGGTSYTVDNYAGPTADPVKVDLWAASLANVGELESALELGCNMGLNLRAIHEVRPDVKLSAVEINPRAAQSVRSFGYVEVFEQSLLDFDQPRRWDLVFIRGVLMHLDPELLHLAYDVIDKHAGKYVIINENFSETPEVVPYKGRNDLLMSRHFAQEFCERFKRWHIIADGWDYRHATTPSNRDRRWFVLLSK